MTQTFQYFKKVPLKKKIYVLYVNTAQDKNFQETYGTPDIMGLFLSAKKVAQQSTDFKTKDNQEAKEYEKKRNSRFVFALGH